MRGSFRIFEGMPAPEGENDDFNPRSPWGRGILKKSIFKTAETLENNGFLPFSYAYLALKSVNRY